MILNIQNAKLRISILWFLLPAIAGFLKWQRNTVNNYYIYKGVFNHLVAQTNLYGLYPKEFFDCNHYGPLFGYMIMPFALIPDYIAIPLWVVFQAFVLYKALMVLPIHDNYKWIALLICLVDLMTSSHSVQINPTVAGMIVLSWYYVKKDQVIWAAFFVMFGTFIKLYGIVGLAFWVFSKDKIKYIGYLILWSIVFFALPMLISSPQFIVQTYFDWLQSLTEKNEANEALVNGIGNRQDISIMGLFRRIGGFTNFSNLLFIIPGFLMQVLPLLRFKLYQNKIFQLRYLASLLIFVVIFSSSSESPTFIIATTGVAIWFMTQEFPIKKWVWFLLLFVIIITSLTATDIFPTPAKQFFVFYSLKALPCVLVWFVCIYQLFKTDFNIITSKWIIQD
jgi:hypothetical protein